LIDFLAQTTAPAGPTSKPAPGWFQFISSPMFIILLLLALFMFTTAGGKRKEERKRRDMLSQLKKGDEVVTIGGQVGKVVETRDDRVQLKVDESSNTKIWFLRSAIHRVLEDKAESK
jgi:preprotein translocase subunit YajC